jgi:cytochrome c-type biogenesis protein CcmH/NrfF
MVRERRDAAFLVGLIHHLDDLLRSVSMTPLNRAPAATALLVMIAMVWWMPIASAQSAESEARTLAHQLMSPYCPGLLLANCQSEGGRRLRAEILRRLKSGEKADAIEGDLVRRFGAAIRTVPAFEGIGLIVWTGPLVFGLAGIAMVTLVLRSRGGQNSPIGDLALAEEPSMGARLQDELDALE